MNWQSQTVALLSASLLRPFVLAGAAWVLLRLLQVRHPSSRHAVWTAVLAGMLLLPFVTLLAPHWDLPLLPRRSMAAAPWVSPGAPGAAADEAPGSPAVAAAPDRTGPSAPRSGETAIVWCYLAGLFGMALYRLAGWIPMRRTISRSRVVHGRVRQSGSVLTPVTAGVLRPSVILPDRWREWTPAVRRAALAHEFAHLRRRDTLANSVARWAKCVFWFHPLAWWISRRVAELAELSCDAAALEKTGDPAGYSRILLAFSAEVSQAGRRAAMPGLAMAGGSGIGHRIDQIFELGHGNPRRLSRPGAVLAAVGSPAMCIAAIVGLTAPPPARSASASQPKFDVISIRSVDDGLMSTRPERSPGRFRWAADISYLTSYAWHIPFTRISFKAPASTLVFHIEATTTNLNPTEDETRLMVRSLLEDRFKMKAHVEAKDSEGYALAIAKGGLKMRETPPEELNDAPYAAGTGGPKVILLQAHNATMAVLAESLQYLTHQMVWDETALTGHYDFSLKYAYRDDPTADAPTLATALRETAGLELRKQRGPVDSLVVDSLLKEPTGN